MGPFYFLFFYYCDKLSIALNATMSSGLLWIHQKDLEGHTLIFCAHPGGMSLIARRDVFDSSKQGLARVV